MGFEPASFQPIQRESKCVPCCGSPNYPLKARANERSIAVKAAAHAAVALPMRPWSRGPTKPGVHRGRIALLDALAFSAEDLSNQFATTQKSQTAD